MRSISKTSVCDLVIDEIKNLIVNQKYKPGERLPSEVELTKYFNVGRGSIREALKRLEMVGMVKILHGKGVVVADHDSVQNRMRFLNSSLLLSAPQFHEIMEARRVIENATVRLAAEKATPDQIRRMEELTKEMDRYVDSPEDFIRLDIEYHMILAEASGNKLLPHFLNSVRDLIKRQQEETTPVFGASQKGNEYHRKIVAAIRKHDPEEASKIMNSHIDEIEETYSSTHQDREAPKA